MRLSLRTTRAHLVLCALALCALVLTLPLGAEEAARPILPVDQVERGQRGYGLTVFAGTEVERFEVEVLGVVRNDSPGSNFILARLRGGPEDQDLEQTGVIRGMSGSPVFIDDKLVGAVAFSWAFVEGAVAGITPIEEMRRLQDLPRPESGPSHAAVGSPPVPLDRLLAGDLPEDLLARQLTGLASPPVLGQATSLQWAAAGFGEDGRRLLEKVLGGVAPMGVASLGAASLGAVPMGSGDAAVEEAIAPPDPQPGDALAVVLVDGDFKLGPAGTVTDRNGDSVVAFGHPFLGAGPVRVPMAEAEVVTVVSSQSNSFKVTNLGRHIGAIEQDRDAGIQGRLGVDAPMFPVTIRVRGQDGPGASFRVRIAAIPQLGAGLLALSTFNALDVTRYTGGLQGLDLDARIGLAEHGEVRLVQSFDGPNAAGEVVSFLLATVGYLLQNELEQVELEEVEIDLTQHPRPRTASLVAAHAERSVVRPGQSVTLNLDLLPWRGTPFRRSVAVDIPEDVPEGRYFFFVGDGASIDAARLALEPAEPISLAQALRLIRSLHTRRQLGVLGFFSGHGLSVAGEVMPRLPGSMASIWGAAPSGSAKSLRLVIAQERFEEMEQPLEGLVRIDLEVRRREPVTGERAAEDGPQADGVEGAGEASSGGGESPSAEAAEGDGRAHRDGTRNRD